MQQENSYSGWAASPSLPPPMENRAAVRLASELSPTRGAVGISPRQFPGHASSGMCPNFDEAFMRWVLGTLTAVDGAVVLNDKLIVLGFGAKISTEPKDFTILEWTPEDADAAA